MRQQDNTLPDLILLDLRMPIMNGFEFINKIKKDHKYKEFKNIPILLCTSLEDKPKLKNIKKYIEDCVFKNSVKDIRVKLSNALNSILV
jgi:CheY-like chemotaxis protein